MVNLHKFFVTLPVCESFMANRLLKNMVKYLVNYFKKHMSNGGKEQQIMNLLVSTYSLNMHHHCYYLFGYNGVKHKSNFSTNHKKYIYLCSFSCQRFGSNNVNHVITF